MGTEAKQQGGSFRFIIVYVLFTLVALYMNIHADISVPPNKPFAEFPMRVGDWRMTRQDIFSDNVLNILSPTDYLARRYETPDGMRADLYVGYHGGGKGTGGIHSPKHCLPGSGWFQASSETTTLKVGLETIHLVRAVFQKGESSELIFYWFQVRDRSLTDEYALKLSEITNSMLYRRRDTSFIRITIPFETDKEKALAAGTAFIKAFYPEISGFLPR
ncbi:exosortase C-terminal domain/associated protein EpsI [Geobacter benzoatilyticus]|uniref:EpsI family protein n=1 Tax=Geobacter benzoatilyticus TaxID=2815309 RepID=A0ABX7Q275_9BACT|nr:exosortase C-terminal domain/associated protein EpsI [Geobacter benzoatilyticus]QSV45046.1 EpsI family protein [Geobacter benzoatilyticus]